MHYSGIALHVKLRMDHVCAMTYPPPGEYRTQFWSVSEFLDNHRRYVLSAVCLIIYENVLNTYTVLTVSD